MRTSVIKEPVIEAKNRSALNRLTKVLRLAYPRTSWEALPNDEGDFYIRIGDEAGKISYLIEPAPYSSSGNLWVGSSFGMDGLPSIRGTISTIASGLAEALATNWEALAQAAQAILNGG